MDGLDCFCGQLAIPPYFWHYQDLCGFILQAHFFHAALSTLCQRRYGHCCRLDDNRLLRKNIVYYRRFRN